MVASMKRSIYFATCINSLLLRKCGAFHLSSTASRTFFQSHSRPRHYHVHVDVQHRRYTYSNHADIHIGRASNDRFNCLYSTNTSTPTKTEKILTQEQIEAYLGPGRTIATEPFCWSQLQHIVNEGDPSMHSRSMEGQYDYIEHSKIVKKEWKSVNDFILHSKFGFDKILNQNDEYEASPSLEEAKMEQRVEKRLLLNEYPYFVADGIEHWCLWKLGGIVTQDEIEDAIAELNESRTLEDVLSWVNPPHLQSIPDIDHAHLLCLVDSSSSSSSSSGSSN